MALFCLISFGAKANVLLDETFSTSAAGSNLDGIWTTNGSTAPTAEGAGAFITNSALTYTDANGEYFLSGVGKGIEVINPPASGANTWRYFKSLGTTLDSGIFYMSFLYEANGEQTQVAADVMAFLTGGANSQQCVTLFAGKGLVDESKVRFGVLSNATSEANITWGVEEFDVNATLFIVLKHEIDGVGATAIRTTSVYVNPPLGGEEPAQALAANVNSTQARNPHSIMTRLGTSAANFSVSGIRVSNAWADAVQKKSEAPQLAAPVVGVASDIEAESFTANWTAVANAVGYTVNLYKGTDLFGVYPAAGQATTQLVINRVTAATSYTYKVIANGDLTNNSDSDESAASAVFTTLEAPEAPETAIANFDDGTWGEAADTIPAMGTFPTWVANGFEFEKAALRAFKQTGPRGEIHENSIVLDRKSQAGMIILPTVKSIEQLEIHGYSGTASVRSFTVKEYNGATWDAVGTYETTRNDTIYLIAISRTEPTKLRIENEANGNIYISKIVTRTSNPVLLDTPPVALEATNPTDFGFTANWSTVENASGYTVLVYQGEAATFVNAYPAAGQATASLAITGLVSGTAHSYKVIATGDDVNYVDSYISNTIEIQTTGTPPPPSGILENQYDSSVLYSVDNAIYVSEAGTLSIYNLQGAMIHQTPIVDKFESSLNAGMYIVRLETNTGKSYTSKIQLK